MRREKKLQQRSRSRGYARKSRDALHINKCKVTCVEREAIEPRGHERNTKHDKRQHALIWVCSLRKSAHVVLCGVRLLPTYLALVTNKLGDTLQKVTSFSSEGQL